MNRLGVILILIIISQSAYNQDFKKYFTGGVLRFDYFRTGDKNNEIISNDAIYKEPQWGGSKINLIDTFNMGNYKFEVLDSLSSELIYSRGFSSLFYEWRFTTEAKSIKRSFSETVIFPFPKKTVKLIFYERDKSMNWKPQYEVYLNPSDYAIIKQQPHKTKSFKILGSNLPDKALDIVLLAEGYTEADMQKFMKDAQRFALYLINCEPFAQMKDKINIWAVPVASLEVGTDLPGENVWKNTVFDSHFYTFGTERYLNTLNNKMVRNYASNAPYDQIYILANTDKYGGAGIYNYYSICTSDHKNSDFVFVHEFGHAMAGLGDEYYTSDVSTDSLYPLNVEPWEPNLTNLTNFDAKWKSILPEDLPIPTPSKAEFKDKTGVFEGGGYIEKGIYRPAYDCTMKSIRYNDFCEVCTKAIIDMIEFYAN